eukprot:c215_g1_i1 orf=139-429(+)
MASTNATAAAALPASSAVDQLLAGASHPMLSAAPLQLIALPPPPLKDGNADISLPLQGFYTLPKQARDVPQVEVPKTVTEYPMPGARQTHEMAVVG